MPTFHQPNSRVEISPDLGAYIQKLKKLTNDFSYSEKEASLALPHDPVHLANAQALHSRLTTHDSPLKFVVVIGIGGSNLGILSLYEALTPPAEKVTGQYTKPRLLCLDTTHTGHTKAVIDVLKKQTEQAGQIVICLVSKSGGTTETISNAEVLLAALGKKYVNITSRVVAITDEGSALDILAKNKHLSALHLPKMVGGRYSVFTTVGLFPALCLGLDVDQLLAGARAANEEGLTGGPTGPVTCALHLYDAHEQHMAIHDLFLFDGRLEMLGKWYRQLLAESLGKQGRGLMPTVSIGSTDLHSVVQLYLGGKNNRYTTFVWVDQGSEMVTPTSLQFPLVKHLEGRSLGYIHKAIYDSTVAAYAKTGRAHNQIHLEAIDEYTLGWYMQSSMIWTMLLGHLLAVDAFDQPQVEVYKQLMREKLSR